MIRGLNLFHLGVDERETTDVLSEVVYAKPGELQHIAWRTTNSDFILTPDRNNDFLWTIEGIVSDYVLRGLRRRETRPIRGSDRVTYLKGSGRHALFKISAMLEVGSIHSFLNRIWTSSHGFGEHRQIFNFGDPMILPQQFRLAPSFLNSGSLNYRSIKGFAVALFGQNTDDAFSLSHILPERYKNSKGE